MVSYKVPPHREEGRSHSHPATSILLFGVTSYGQEDAMIQAGSKVKYHYKLTVDVEIVDVVGAT